MGGLGNQMFQYAAGRALAARRDVELKLDLSWFGKKHKHTTPRRYSLDNFNISAPTISRKELLANRGCTRNFFHEYIMRFFRRSLKEGPKLKILKEISCNYGFTEIEKDVNLYLDGYWQSEKYFNESKQLIHQELTVRRELFGKNLEYANKIKSCESVGIHIRRGDYVSDPVISSIHGICHVSYYAECLKALSSMVGKNIYCFVFSDDIKWVKENIFFEFHTDFVDHNNPDNSYEDLRLMSLCKHNVIANSSFSWWGAWLNTSYNKIVFAPKRWLLNDERNTEDIIPKSWIRL